MIMGPRNLQSQIHSSYATGSSVWSDYRNQIKSMHESSSAKGDFNDHLIREYNKKINKLNQASELYIAPYDAGFRFTGSSISGGKSVSLRFYMGSTGGVTITIGGVSKNMSGSSSELTFTPSEVSSLNLSGDLNVSGYIVASPDISSIDISAEDTLKVNNLSYNPDYSTNFSFTIVYNQLSDTDTLDFQVVLNT